MRKISSLMLLALVFLLSACRTENLIEESNPINQSSQLQLSSKTISLAEAKHKLRLITELTRAKDLLSNIKSDASGKTVNYGNGFTINTDKVLYIESDTNHHSYTFNIQRDNQSANEPLENLVLSPLADGTYKELLVSYNLTQQEKHTLLVGGAIDTKDKITVTELTKGTFNDNGQLEKTITGSTCGYEEEQVWISCSKHVHNQNNVSEWTECIATEGPRMYTIITWKCHYTYDSGTPENPGGGEGLGPGEVGGGVPTQPVTVSSFPRFVKNLPSDLKAIINAPENEEFYTGLDAYYNLYYEEAETRDFIKWAIQFKADNPSTTWKQFNNWFMTKSEGQDGEYISSLDNILNSAQYQTKQMPTYSQFVSAFPKVDYPGYPGYYLKMPASQVYPIIGGYLESLYNDKKDNGPFRNACAARWSLGMNGAGILIPQNNISISGANINGQPRYYIVNSTAAGDFMQKTFGNPTHKLQGADANNATKIANFLNGKTGIYVVVNNSYEEAGYYGHIDLIQNGHIPGGANVQNVPGGIKSIRIWEFTP